MRLLSTWRADLPQGTRSMGGGAEAVRAVATGRGPGGAAGAVMGVSQGSSTGKAML